MTLSYVIIIIGLVINMINELYAIQEQLNNRIIKEHDLKEEDLSNDRFMALLVELGELANETRCFKYWSLKKPSEKDVIIEEFSDVLHFLLTIGIQLDKPQLSFYDKKTDLSLTELFLSLYSDINVVRMLNSKFVFIRAYNTLMLIGQTLGFSEKDIYDSYLEKNKVNHKRQDHGY